MKSQEIYKKYLKAKNEYDEENLKFMESNSSDNDSFVHLMYLMGRMHALDELYMSSCIVEENL